MSDTPRTDAAIFQILSSLQSGTDEVVHADFARQLERELAECNAEWNERYQRMMATEEKQAARIAVLESCLQRAGKAFDLIDKAIGEHDHDRR